MGPTKREQERLVNREVEGWTAELTRLANLIAAAKGTTCALVMIYGTDEGYADIAPELIMEDAFRVNPHGWPQGFSIDLLNPSK